MIRRFEQQDIDTIMQIWLVTNVEAHTFIPAIYWKENYQMVMNMILQAEIWVYEEHQTIVGFTGICDSYIAGIFVSSNFQSKGIGTQLLHHIKKYHPSLSLHVYQKNEQAIKFYLRQNFKILSKGYDTQVHAYEYLMEWK